MHDVASSTGSHAGAVPTPRKQGSTRRYPKSALQKLLSMVEPIMSPLRNEHPEADKEEQHTSHTVDAILSSPGQRNSFQMFLQEHTSQTSLRGFQFLCLCKQFRDWDEKIQYGPYRIRVLANHIYQNFIRDNAPHALEFSDVQRKKVERTIHESRINPTVFEELYQCISLQMLQQNVVKKFLESGYNHTMYDVDQVDWLHLKGLSLGPSTGPFSASRGKFCGSLGSSTSSSSISSRSKLSGSNFLGQSMSSDLSSAGVSEIQSVSSSRTGSSKGSTGSNASVAYDKYYINKNSHKKSRKKAPIQPKKLMEELLPRLEAVAIEQNIRIQNFGGLDSGPDGGDTPIVVINTRNFSPPSHLLTTEDLDHSTRHALPHTIKTPFPLVRPATLISSSEQQDRTEDRTQNRSGSHSGTSLEDMICEEEIAPRALQHVANRHKVPETQHKTDTPAWTNDARDNRGPDIRTRDNQASSEPATSQIHIAYSFNSEDVLFGKVLSGPHVTLAQFKEVVTWNSQRLSNARYFFKRQIPGIGEVHDEVSTDESILPLWTPNTIFARVQCGD